MGCRDVLGRTPFASLIATVLCALGVGIFCGAFFRALEITLKGIFEGLFLFRVQWLVEARIVFIAIAVGMGLYAILLLVFGFLSTGATRQNIYSGAKCIMGGRVSAAFFMVFTYILNILWVIVTSFTALPIIIFIMLKAICQEEIENRPDYYFKNYCFNLSRFGIYKNATENVVKNALCEANELQELCQHVEYGFPMYCLAFAGSLIIVLALVMFMIIGSINYQRIKVAKELTDYRGAVELDFQTDARSGGTLGSKLSLT